MTSNAPYYEANKARIKAQASAWARDNKERKNRNAKTYYNKNKDAYWEGQIKRKYGLTKQNYEALLKSQKGACAVCNTHETGSTNGKFYIDHDHVTLRVRGLLCRACNVGIGIFQDSPSLLDNAAAYLRQHTG